MSPMKSPEVTDSWLAARLWPAALSVLATRFVVAGGLLLAIALRCVGRRFVLYLVVRLWLAALSVLATRFVVAGESSLSVNYLCVY